MGGGWQTKAIGNPVHICRFSLLISCPLRFILKCFLRQLKSKKDAAISRFTPVHFLLFLVVKVSDIYIVQHKISNSQHKAKVRIVILNF